MIRTLVYGGAGFIGSHLVEALVKTDREVHVIDNLSYCHDDNLDEVSNSPNFVFHDYDAKNYVLGHSERWDEIYHLAGVVSTEDFVENPIEAFRVAVDPLIRMLDYKQRFNKEARLLFASSSEVYGESTVLPTPESYIGKVDPCGPRSGYDEGKRAGESLIVGYQTMHNVTCARVRLFNTFGPRMRANGRLVPTMVKDALKTGSIRINGDGSNTRTLLYVDDCVNALILAMGLQCDVPINIGGLKMQTIKEIAEMIGSEVKTVTGISVSYIRDKVIPHDIFLRQPSIHLAKELLNWSPLFMVRSGIREVVKYWEGRIQ